MYNTKNTDYRLQLKINDIITKDLINEYTILKELGCGAYGNVLKVKHNVNNKIYALKVFKNKLVYNENADIEIKILKMLNKELNKNSYVCKFLEEFSFKGSRIIKLDIYYNNIYCEYTQNNYNIKDITVLSHNICKGLNYLKKNRVIHGDLKPENILLRNKDSLEVVICDFGLSIIHSNMIPKTNFLIQTIWYRSPEIIFNFDYNYAIDIWSFGCIIFELVFNNPLFECKKNSILYLLIIEFIGYPNDSYLDSKEYTYFCKSNWNDLSKGIDLNNKIKMKQRIDFIKKNNNLNIISTLIYNTIKWNQNERLTIEECLKLFEINNYLD